MEKIPQTYDPTVLARILQGMQKQIESLQPTKLRRIKSVAAEAAQNLAVNEAGYVLDDTGQDFDLVVRGEDSRWSLIFDWLHKCSFKRPFSYPCSQSTFVNFEQFCPFYQKQGLAFESNRSIGTHVPLLFFFRAPFYVVRKVAIGIVYSVKRMVQRWSVSYNLRYIKTKSFCRMPFFIDNNRLVFSPTIPIEADIFWIITTLHHGFPYLIKMMVGKTVCLVLFCSYFMLKAAT